MCIWRKKGKPITIPAEKPRIAYKVLSCDEQTSGIPQTLRLEVWGRKGFGGGRRTKPHVLAMHNGDKITLEQAIELLQKAKLSRTSSYQSPQQGTKWTNGELKSPTSPHSGNGYRGYGIYCFKSAKKAEKYRSQYCSNRDPIVKLEIWGECIEHKAEYYSRSYWEAKDTKLEERVGSGYRAQYARIVKEVKTK